MRVKRNLLDSFSSWVGLLHASRSVHLALVSICESSQSLGRHKSHSSFLHHPNNHHVSAFCLHFYVFKSVEAWRITGDCITSAHESTTQHPSSRFRQSLLVPFFNAVRLITCTIPNKRNYTTLDGTHNPKRSNTSTRRGTLSAIQWRTPAMFLLQDLDEC